MMATSVAMAANDLTIFTGLEGGNYHKQAMRLSALVSNSSSVANTTVVPTSGSLAILDKVSNTPSSLGFAQMDAVAYEKSKGNDRFDVVGTLNDECIMFVVSKDSDIDSIQDLKDKKVSVGMQGSGGEPTLLYIKKLEPKFSTIQMQFDTPNQVINQIASRVNGAPDAFMFVGTINETNKYVSMVNANADKLGFVPANDYDLNDDLDGRPVYAFKEVVTKKGLLSNDEFTTACTSVAVVVNREIDPAITDKVSEIMLTNQQALTNTN